MNNFLNIKIVFMGTPAIAASLLERLLQEGFNVIAVIAQPDARLRAIRHGDKAKASRCRDAVRTPPASGNRRF